MIRPHDRRMPGVALAAAVIFLGGGLIAWLGPAHNPEQVDTTRVNMRLKPDAHPGEVSRLFNAAVLMLHAKQYESAATALHRVLALAPQMPEAHTNMGFAMLGLQRPSVAHDFFEGAIALKADQANAYYGLALAHEATGALDLAVGAMRSYLHLARTEDEAHLRRARAALWEWEARLTDQRANAKR
jgi:tetratricopeptide (TPR) repeat protein